MYISKVKQTFRLIFSCKRVDFLKVVRLVFWSGELSLARASRLLARALRSYDRATRSKARLVSKSSKRAKISRTVLGLRVHFSILIQIQYEINSLLMASSSLILFFFLTC